MTYNFAMLRFVPDTARGEFVNIGAIAGDEDGQDWELRLISNLKRARAIDQGSYLPHALSVAGDFQERLLTEDVPTPAGGWLAWPELRALAGEMNNILQLSQPSPIVAESAEAALDIVFEELTLDPASRQFRFEKKHRAVGATRQAYRSADVPDAYVKQKVLLSSGAFTSPFDFAVQNGRAVQVVQCWSFQLPNQFELGEQVKAWAWTVGQLRANGGEIRSDAGHVEVPDQLEVGAVCIPPREDADNSAYREALSAFDGLDVRLVTPEHAGELARSAAAALAVFL